jgi:transposase
MNAYPLELRTRIVDAVDRGVGSAQQVARLFKVAPNTVYHLLRLRAQTGAVLPRPNPGGQRPAIGPERYDEVRRLLAEQPDLTLEQLRDRLGVNCSLAAVCRALQKLGLTRKKKRSTRPSSSAPTSRRPGRSGPSGKPR